MSQKLSANLATLMVALFASITFSQTTVLVEAEGFTNKGGWKVDQQFFENMGSPMLLAHGLGRPVADASTSVNFPTGGTYHVYVRTRDWVIPHGPGRFQLLINGTPLDTTFGIGGNGQWDWKYGGAVNITSASATVAIKDLTGYDGRVDAIVFSSTQNPTLPNNMGDMRLWRNQLLGIPNQPIEEGFYDLVVVGGGIGGICAAVAAARMGLKVALIQNRSVLGGNNSSEIRVHMLGKYMLGTYPIIGEIVNEIRDKNAHIPENAEEASAYNDDVKMKLVTDEPNIDLFLNNHVFAVEMHPNNKNQIISVTSKHTHNNTEHKFRGFQFVDCTGDGTVGFLAGAEYMYGREARAEFNEPSAPVTRDSVLMGYSNQWVAKPTNNPRTIIPLPWAHQIPTNRNQQQYEDLKTAKNWNVRIRGEWFWEGGILKNKLTEAEYIRDNNFRAIFGYFYWLQTASSGAAKYAQWDLDWVAYVSGRRESRRLVGDLILKEQDLVNMTIYPDAAVTATWSIDLHYPRQWNLNEFGEDAFISYADHNRTPDYPIPYRTLYSKNINNLYMAGRDISVTHIALGKVRVMATAGMMGEVIGRAAHLARLNLKTPRGVYEDHLSDLTTWFNTTIGYTGNYPALPDSITRVPVIKGVAAQPNKLDYVVDEGKLFLAKGLFENSEIHFELMDITGRILERAKGIQSGKGNTWIPFNKIKNLKGLYFIRAETGNWAKVNRLLLK